MNILIATNNPGKSREFAAVLSQGLDRMHEINWKSLADIGSSIAEPVEDGETFLANAGIKATYYSKATGLWALADDSGLEVDALAGEPGVHSAYFDRTSAKLPRIERDRANNLKLMNSIRGVTPEKRTARYRCVLVLADANIVLATSEAIFEGVIIDQPRGSGGFGYDPLFLVPSLGKTVAELTAEEKNQISHRGKALQLLRIELHRLISNGQSVARGDKLGQLSTGHSGL